MSVLPKEIPFEVGTRVCILSLDVVGTVTKHTLGQYEVTWLDQKGTVKKGLFMHQELAEQFELPFDDRGRIFDV